MTLDISTSAIESWKRKLPEDVRASLDDGNVSSEGSGLLITTLESSVPGAMPGIIRQSVDEVTAFGRARRVRIICYLAANGDITELLREDDEEGGGGAVARIFLDDVKAVMAAFGPRIARSMVTDATTAPLLDSVRSIEGEFEHTMRVANQ